MAGQHIPINTFISLNVKYIDHIDRITEISLTAVHREELQTPPYTGAEEDKMSLPRARNVFTKLFNPHKVLSIQAAESGHYNNDTLRRHKGFSKDVAKAILTFIKAHHSPIVLIAFGITKSHFRALKSNLNKFELDFPDDILFCDCQKAFEEVDKISPLLPLPTARCPAPLTSTPTVLAGDSGVFSAGMSASGTAFPFPDTPAPRGGSATSTGRGSDSYSRPPGGLSWSMVGGSSSDPTQTRLVIKRSSSCLEEPQMSSTPYKKPPRRYNLAALHHEFIGDIPGAGTAEGDSQAVIRLLYLESRTTRRLLPWIDTHAINTF